MAEETTTTGNATAVPPSRPPEGDRPEKKGSIAETFSGLRVSLVPKEFLGQDGPDLKLRLLVLAMVMILETGGILAGLYVLNGMTERKEAEKAVLIGQFEDGKAEAAMQEQQMRDAIIFSQQMKSAIAALDRHVYPFDMVNFLESNTLSGIKYDRINVNLSTGMLMLDVVAPKFRSMAEQIVHFSGLEDVLQLKNSSVTAMVDSAGHMSGVNASLVLKLNPAVWIGHKSSIVPNQQ